MNARIVEILQRLLGGFVDSFKMKNPTVFAFVQSGLLAITGTLGTLLLNGDIQDTQVCVFGFCFGVVQAVISVLAVLTALLGAHTPESAAAKALREKSASPENNNA